MPAPRQYKAPSDTSFLREPAPEAVESPPIRVQQVKTVLEPTVVKPAKPDTRKEDQTKAFLQKLCSGMNMVDAHAEASRLLMEFYA